MARNSFEAMRHPATAQKPTSDSELGCTGAVLAAVVIPFSLLSIKVGDVFFMRFFYGTGEDAPRLIDSKHGTLSDGHSIPALLNVVRIVIDMIPAFTVAIVVAAILIGMKRRWAKQ
jgi:hypothetical protein